MGIYYQDLNQETREFMISELEYDIENNNIYFSPRLNEFGCENWVLLLKKALESENDDWLANGIQENSYLKTQVERRKPKGGVSMARVPSNANQTLAEGEFNRYYMRGLCQRVLTMDMEEIEIYRGKEVNNPRSESERMIGQKCNAKNLLSDLRKSIGVEPALMLPPGPNSGLTAKISD